MNFFVKILAALFFNSLFFCALNAQEVAVQQSDIRIVNGQVQVEVSLTASQLDLGSTDRFRLEFSIDGPNRKLLLPEVIYTGTQRGHFDGRNAFLSGGIQVPAYHIEYDIKVGRSYELDYRISIPYQSWMEHASVSFRGYLLVCGEEINTMNRLLSADLNPLRQLTVPNVWTPDRAVYSRMVCFLVPQSEEVKKWADKVEVNIDYPVNDAQVRPAYGRNAEELQKVKELMDDILGHALITVDRLSVTGYASPEGSYRANEQLARRRAEGFTQYLQNNYRLRGLLVDTRWVAEDWDGFITAVRAADLPQKNDILRIANNRDANPDSRERMLNQLAPRGSELHRQINAQIYPPLRRIRLDVAYTVEKFSDETARELVCTDPGLLSLVEMYRAAASFEPGSPDYLKIYETAVQEYPDDRIANNNAAAALLAEGEADKAKAYLEKGEENDPAAYLNLGTYYYIEGDLSKAEHFFRQAEQAGVQQAEQNLRLLQETAK